MGDGRLEPGAIAALKRFAKPRRAGERCELCAADLSPAHSHLLAPGTRKLACACEACALLFGDRPDARYLRVPRGVSRLADFRMTEALWDDLAIPIGLAFFYRRGAETVAGYPSPAGAVESVVPPGQWGGVAAANSVLAGLRPEVEALVANRIAPPHQYFIAPIDECFRLVGLVRSHWRGLAGGGEVWAAVREFFAELGGRACPR